MKKLLIGSVVVVLCSGAPVVYADDAHHPEQAAPASESATGKSVLPKKPTASDKSMNGSGDSEGADVQMGKAQERMKQAQAIMARLRDSKDPAERKKLMQQHTQAMRDTMGMMRDMKMGMMGGGQGMGMGMMGQGKGKTQTDGMMDMHQMMEERMEMMQMMMEQLIERQSQ